MDSVKNRTVTLAFISERLKYLGIQKKNERGQLFCRASNIDWNNAVQIRTIGPKLIITTPDEQPNCFSKFDNSPWKSNKCLTNVSIFPVRV